MGLLPPRTERPKSQYLTAAYAERAWLDWSVRELRYEAEANEGRCARSG